MKPAWSHRLITAPAAEPFSVDEAKAHLRVDGASDDALILRIVMAMRGATEEWLGRALLTQTRELTLDGFPARDDVPIRLPRPPLQSVSSVKYVDTADVLQTWAASGYQVDGASPIGRLMPVDGGSWPSVKSGTLNTVQVRYVAGYGETSALIPPDILQAMLLSIGDFYENRENVITGTIVAELPNAAKTLLMPHRVWF